MWSPIMELWRPGWDEEAYQLPLFWHSMGFGKKNITGSIVACPERWQRKSLWRRYCQVKYSQLARQCQRCQDLVVPLTKGVASPSTCSSCSISPRSRVGLWVRQCLGFLTSYSAACTLTLMLVRLSFAFKCMLYVQSSVTQALSMRCVILLCVF